MKKFFILTLILLMTATLLCAQTDPSAAFQISSTTQGFLPSRMTTTERNGISSPAVGLTLYNTNLKSLETHIGGDSWVKLGTLSSTTGVISVVSSLPTSGIIDRNVYFETTSNTFNIFRNGFWYSFNHDRQFLFHKNLLYEIITSSTGKVWLDRNIGATQKPTAITDTGSDFGNFFSWADATAADVCPSGFHLPTKAEWEDEEATFATNGGDNHIGAWNVLKLARTGYRSSGSGTSATNDLDSGGNFWSSTQEDSSHAWYLDFYSNDANVVSVSKPNGNSVRCIQD